MKKKMIIIQNDIKTKLIIAPTVLTVVLKNKLFTKMYKLIITQCCHIVWSGKNTESKTRRVLKTSNGKIMFLLKCGMCDNKNQDFQVSDQIIKRKWFWNCQRIS